MSTTSPPLECWTLPTGATTAITDLHVTTTTTTTTTPAVLTPTGAVSRSIATNNGTSVLRARTIAGPPPLATAIADRDDNIIDAPTTTPSRRI